MAKLQFLLLSYPALLFFLQSHSLAAPLTRQNSSTIAQIISSDPSSPVSQSLSPYARYLHTDAFTVSGLTITNNTQSPKVHLDFTLSNVQTYLDRANANTVANPTVSCSNEWVAGYNDTVYNCSSTLNNDFFSFFVNTTAAPKNASGGIDPFAFPLVIEHHLYFRNDTKLRGLLQGVLTVEPSILSICRPSHSGNSFAPDLDIGNKKCGSKTRQGTLTVPVSVVDAQNVTVTTGGANGSVTRRVLGEEVVRLD